MDKTFYYRQAAKKKAQENAEVDWEKIKLEYETTNISISKLAEKYNISFNTLKDKSYRHKWGKSKQIIQQEINNKATELTIENIAKKRAKALDNHYKISEVLLFQIGKALKNPNELNTWVEKVKDGINSEILEEFHFDSINDRKLTNLISSFEKVQKSQRLTLGIMDNKEMLKQMEVQFKQWLDEEKLKLLVAEENEDDDREQIDNFLEATKTKKEDLEKLFKDD
jgi:phage terminase small subunit